MTDSIKTSLKLTKIAALVRKDIPAQLCTVTNPWGEMTARYTKPSHQQSAMTKTKTKWVVRCATDHDNPELGDLPTRIEADLNIPNSTTGHNLEHGTSVYAAGVAALEQQRIWLAQSGLPQVALDLLSTDDITLRGVTITYLIRCATHEKAELLVDAIKITGKVLNAHWESTASTNVTVKLPARTFTMSAYIKTSLEHCKFPDGAPVADLMEQTSCIVRIEAKLGFRFLQKRNLLALNSWRDAYEQGLYKTLFDETVVKSLRLGKGGLRHKEPREEVYARLTPTEAALLRGYIAGRDPRKFKSVAESKNPGNRYSELRLAILAVAKVDIGIAWVDHVKLRCFELAPQLQYPGDYHPTDAHASWCFCKANWPKLLADLRMKYESALAAAIQKQALR